ncbi:hypothetical protein ACIQRE_01750 [Streptomyces griseoluteus]|uniref:hypothetical protein n=1 Tax=Streptomyces griseoluteus TaxID=29306 RepID=UPI0038109ADD
MNHRPYPDVDRALHQWHRQRRTRGPQLAWLDEHIPDWQRSIFARIAGRTGPHVSAAAVSQAFTRAGVGEEETRGQAAALTGINFPRLSGRGAIIAAIVSEALVAGHHVHVATTAGLRCAGGDSTCIVPRAEHKDAVEESCCPGCEHPFHAPGIACTGGVDHGPKRWHQCLCLNRPGADRKCPPQMDCQGGPLGYTDIWHLRQGRSLSGRGGTLITPEVLETSPLVLARVVCTCEAVPSQWSAWTVDGQYLYLRYRSGIGTVDAYDGEDSDTWTRIPDGAVARFDTGDRLDGDMDLVEFCELAGLQVAVDAEVSGE